MVGRHLAACDASQAPYDPCIAKVSGRVERILGEQKYSAFGGIQRASLGGACRRLTLLRWARDTRESSFEEASQPRPRTHRRSAFFCVRSAAMSSFTTSDGMWTIQVSVDEHLLLARTDRGVRSPVVLWAHNGARRVSLDTPTKQSTWRALSATIKHALKVMHLVASTEAQQDRIRRAALLYRRTCAEHERERQRVALLCVCTPFGALHLPLDVRRYLVQTFLRSPDDALPEDAVSTTMEILA